MRFSNDLEATACNVSCAFDPLENARQIVAARKDFAVFCWHSMNPAANLNAVGTFLTSHHH
jgi:hypothetical protein